MSNEQIVVQFSDDVPEELTVEQRELARDIGEVLERYVNEHDVDALHAHAAVEAYADALQDATGIPDAWIVETRFPDADRSLWSRIRGRVRL